MRLQNEKTALKDFGAKGFQVKRTAFVSVCLVLFAGVCEGKGPLTPLEESVYTRLTTSLEISAFLDRLSDGSACAQKVTVAASALGEPVGALLVASDVDRFTKGNEATANLTVMLVGSQHGTEPSGAETLLLVARDLISGDLRPYLEGMDFILVPNSNPDGRNRNRRVNGNGVNLSTNFVVLSEPESRGIVEAQHRWNPEVLLDIHESALLKKKSLGKEGYLTDFEAQLEAANNPNVDRGIRTFSFEQLLPKVVESVEARGLPARRYIGEITSIHQPITHGGLSIRNLRNTLGMRGTFAFLLENRLDPSTHTYPTPRNIRVRVAKQYLCICSFLECCYRHRMQIKGLCRQARRRWIDPRDREPVYLSFQYVSTPNRPQITLPLRRRDNGALVQQTFTYRGSVERQGALTPPSAYIVADHQDIAAQVLDRHRIHYDRLTRETEAFTEVQGDSGLRGKAAGPGDPCADPPGSQSLEKRSFRPGDLRCRLNQPACRLIPLLLDPRSMNQIFSPRELGRLVKDGQAPFVFRIRASP